VLHSSIKLFDICSVTGSLFFSGPTQIIGSGDVQGAWAKNLKGGIKMAAICFSPIGVIRSPCKEVKGMPIQTTAAVGIAGQVEMAPEFIAGLKDLEGFSHIILIYHLHLSVGYSLEVTPCLDSQSHGIFAARAAKRPNPIGISIVRLIGIEGNTLLIEDVDVVDGTPLLDIKPYVPELDSRHAEKIGWLTGKVEKVAGIRSDERFM
jgi:tRNA-Thr(GGU) m(6)t(6)A37 methyltransferase TsaA